MLAQEICSIRVMMEFLDFPQVNPTIIFEDNAACIQMSRNPAHTSRTKHIDLLRFYLKELVNRHIIQLDSVSTRDQHAEFLTKAVSFDKLQYHHRSISGYSPSSSNS